MCRGFGGRTNQSINQYPFIDGWMDDLGEEFTIKFADDFCNVERSVGDTTSLT